MAFRYKRPRRKANTDGEPNAGSGEASSEVSGDELANERPRRQQKSAESKMVDLLAKRDHSELELRQKLSDRYSEAEIEEALETARLNNWLAAPEEISERTARSLGYKRKGHRYINQYLKSKGLPPVQKNLEEEVRKGCELIRSRLRKEGPFDYNEQRKIYRLLANRGFDDETIRRVINEA